MNRALVVGVGSPAGDDQAGWRVVDLLGARLPDGARALAIRAPSQLWSVLDDREKLILIDAARTGRPPGTAFRLVWPDPAVETSFGPSSHGVGLGAALALADRLGKLPGRVVLFGIEGQDWGPAEDVSPAVARALPGVCEQVEQEIRGER
jgi:hydrogenase maturation protease